MTTEGKLANKEAGMFKRLTKCYEEKQFKSGLRLAKQILGNSKTCKHVETLSYKALCLTGLGRTEEALEVVRCGGRGQLYWPAGHQCHDPLSQGPCAASQLLVLDPASLTARCGDQLQCVHSEEGVEDGDLVWDGTQCIDVGNILYSVIIHSQLFIVATVQNIFIALENE